MGALKLVPQPFKTITQPLRLTNIAGFGGPKTYIASVDSRRRLARRDDQTGPRRARVVLSGVGDGA